MIFHYTRLFGKKIFHPSTALYAPNYISDNNDNNNNLW